MSTNSEAVENEEVIASHIGMATDSSEMYEGGPPALDPALAELLEVVLPDEATSPTEDAFPIDPLLGEITFSLVPENGDSAIAIPAEYVFIMTLTFL